MVLQRKATQRTYIKDADKGEVDVVFSTFNVIDSDGDVTLPGAFEDGAATRISAYGHTSWEGNLPIGRGVITSNEKEAVMSGTFFMDMGAGRETFAMVKGMAELQEWSYGYDVLESSDGQWEGRAVRILKKLLVHEVSPVLLGAGVNTRTLAVKGHSHESPPETISSHLSRAHGVPLEAQPTGAQSRHALHLVMHGGDISNGKATNSLAGHLTEVSASVSDLTDRLARAAAVRAEKGEPFAPEAVEKAAALAAELAELSGKLLLVGDEPEVRLRAEALDAELAMLERQFG